MYLKKALFSLALAASLGMPLLLANEVTVTNLTCEQVETPLGIDVPHPLLGWIAQSTQRGDAQTAYRIVVSDQLGLLNQNKGNLWDSGKIQSTQNHRIAYAGKKLRSATCYYWKVCVYTTAQPAGEWSDAHRFETALLLPGDWVAQWIGDGSHPPANEADFYQADPAPYFSKTIEVKKPIQRARLYITGLGYYEASINGQKVGRQVLDPGWTSYHQTVLYSTHDVTQLLTTGTNQIGILLGNGFYNPLPLRIFKPLREYLATGRPKTVAQLHITYQDGSRQTIPTDRTWHVAPSPILRNNPYLGEHYDARLESNGQPNPLAAQAVLVPAPHGRLQAQMQPPVTATDVLRPQRMTEVRPGVFLFDLGQNLAGVARIKAQGAPGTRITIRYGEDIYSDGSLNVMTSVAGQVKRVWHADRSAPGAPQTAWQEDSYTLKGTGQTEVWQPRFTYHGFRYIELTGFPGRPTLEQVEGVRLAADLKQVGTFRCSNERINRLEEAIRWTFLSNVFSVQSDCPHREKFGYGGDIVATTDAFCYLYDMNRFHTKTVRDYRDARRPSGGMTETAPYMGIADCGFGEGTGPIGWQLAFAHAQKKLYQYYGNQQLIEENYYVLKQQVDFLSSHAPQHIMDEAYCIGDHEALDYDFKPSSPTFRDRSLTATAHYYEHVTLLAEFAGLLRKTNDQAHYQKLAQTIKAAFIKQFYQHETGIFGNHSQTSQAFGLYYGLLPDGHYPKAFQQLVHTIERARGHLITGIFATPMMLRLLADNGRNDLVFQFVNNPEFPGWGYMLERGATTLWETWAYSDNVYSQNHPMFGSVNEWFYRSLLGIQPTSPGFETIRISPQPTGDLAWAKGSYQSVKGTIIVEWEREASGTFTLHTTVPLGVVAQIQLPNTQGKEVTEGGQKLTEAQGIAHISHSNGQTGLQVASGTYTFRVHN